MKHPPTLEIFTMAINTMLDDTELRSATVFDGKGQRVTVSRIHKHDRRNRHTTMALSFGKFNYAQREYVAMRKRQHYQKPECAGMMMTKCWPKPKKGKKK